MNYDKLMIDEINSIEKSDPTLLLHACCAPCSSACLERLGDTFKITILYYNPNIDNEDEYNKRLEELHKFISMFKTKNEIKIIDGRYDTNEFKSIVLGLEEEPERGKRCYKCYKLRMEETAKVADKLGFDYFATTLSLSPHKNTNWINEIGEDLDKEYNTKYLYSDFKKHEGYKRSIELSHEYNLYRQDYCGCIYSKKNKLDRG